MEPVPETERMEEFRSSPLPSLRLHNSPSFTLASPTPPSPRSSSDPENSLRKPYPRRSTDPASPVFPSWPSPPPLPYRPRTTSPLSGSHMRSRSTASIGSLYPPALGRTQSMPGVNGAGHLQFRRDPRSFSPSLSQRPPALTVRTPKKSLIEDVFPSSPTRVSVIHDSDRQLHERNSSPNLGIHTLPSIANDSVSELRIASQPLAQTRRPSSPYRRVSPTSGPTSAPGPTNSAPALITSTSSPLSISNFSSFSGGNIGTIVESPSAPSLGTPSSSAASSPIYRPSDMLLSAPSYSSLGGLSSSSVPSTPTSTRSRSPSISSLETIPDTPDAEEAALEAERIAQLKAAAEAAENGDGKKGGSMDLPTRGRTLAFGARDKRKRWSVCGAERRGDLDLETIWED